MPRRPNKAKIDRKAPSGKGKAGRRQEFDREDVTGDTIEEHDDGFFVVRMITGSSSTKPYRCPGCDQLIKTATPHIVAWLEHDVETRRHWHTPCWRSRGRRKPKIERTRNAPKY